MQHCNDKPKILIFFDIGGILLRTDNAAWYRVLGIPVENLSKFQKMSARVDFNYGRGTISLEKYLSSLRTYVSIPRNVLKKRVTDNVTGPITEMIALKRKLIAAGYTVGLLSNIGQQQLKIYRKKYPLVFTRSPHAPCIFSCKVKTAKPFQRIYRLVRGYEKIVFIDDKPKNIVAAVRNPKWHGIWLTAFRNRNEPLPRIQKNVPLPKIKAYHATSLKECLAALTKERIML